MRVVPWAVALIVVAGVACPASQERSQSRDAGRGIDSLNARVAKAYADHDPAAYAALFTDSAVFEWPAVPTVRGRAGLQAMAREVWAPLRNIELKMLVSSRHITGDHATEFGAFEESWDGDSAKRNTEYGRYASTLRRENGGWLMEHFFGFEDSVRSAGFAPEIAAFDSADR